MITALAACSDSIGWPVAAIVIASCAATVIIILGFFKWG